MIFQKAAHYLRYLIEKADVRDPVRVSIKFQTNRDLSLFTAELFRELQLISMAPANAERFGEGEITLNGIAFRLFSDEG